MLNHNLICWMCCRWTGLWNTRLRGEKERQCFRAPSVRTNVSGRDPQSIWGAVIVPVLWHPPHSQESANCSQWMFLGRGLDITITSFRKKASNHHKECCFLCNPLETCCLSIVQLLHKSTAEERGQISSAFLYQGHMLWATTGAYVLITEVGGQAHTIPATVLLLSLSTANKGWSIGC